MKSEENTPVEEESMWWRILIRYVLCLGGREAR